MNPAAFGFKATQLGSFIREGSVNGHLPEDGTKSTRVSLVCLHVAVSFLGGPETGWYPQQETDPYCPMTTTYAPLEMNKKEPKGPEGDFSHKNFA